MLPFSLTTIPTPGVMKIESTGRIASFRATSSTNVHNSGASIRRNGRPGGISLDFENNDRMMANSDPISMITRSHASWIGMLPIRRNK
jgi:hypothetical protein